MQPHRMQVGKHYLLEGSHGRETLEQLFAGRSQLIVYRVLFGPDWDASCPSCSFLASHFDGALPHLAQHDVTLIAASRAPIARIDAFKRRMGWQFKWVSCGDNNPIGLDESPGATVFYKDEWGDVFQTYSCYASGLDIMGAHTFLDLSTSWVRHRDRCEPPRKPAIANQHPCCTAAKLIA